jgi:hypothetical protein
MSLLHPCVDRCATSPDAPDELLDERLIGLRNAAYLSAYPLYVWGDD